MNLRRRPFQLYYCIISQLITLFRTDLTVKLNQSIDEWSGEMHWMKNALTEWMQAMEQGNATVSLIQQYCITDQKRADALELRSRKLQMTILNSSMQLRDLCDTQISLEQTLDGTANLYRQRHLDRGQMVDTWRETVAALNGRDKAIRNIEEVRRNIYLFGGRIVYAKIYKCF